MKMFCKCGIVLLVAMTLQMSYVNARTIDEQINRAHETSLADFGPGSNDMVRVELDIMFTKQELEELNARRSERKAVRYLEYRWTSSIVPYRLRKGVFSSREKNAILSAVADWEKYTCLKFRLARSYDKNRIVFEDGDGCGSRLGMRGGKQVIGLADGCRTKGIVIHEIGHALGFIHEQGRPDRDDFVTIVKRNIHDDKFGQFMKYAPEDINIYKVPYDYTSVMHYGQHYFSKNYGVTILTKDAEYQDVIGNRVGLSYLDVKLANLMYSCSAHCNWKTCPENGFLGKDCECYCEGEPISRCAEGAVGLGAATTPVPTTPPTTSSTTTVLAPTETSTVCNDDHNSCQLWAAQGFCEGMYAGFMARTCKKSCNKCPSSCSDRYGEFCANWAAEGFCQGSIYTDYMQTNCQQTCGFCA